MKFKCIKTEILKFNIYHHTLKFLPNFYAWIFSSVAERWTCNLKVVSSNPVRTLGFFQSFIVFFRSMLHCIHILVIKFEIHMTENVKRQSLKNLAKNWLLIGKRFLVSQSDVDEFENWEHVPNAYEKTISEMPSDVLEHFFSGLFIWKIDVLYSKFPLKSLFLSLDVVQFLWYFGFVLEILRSFHSTLWNLWSINFRVDSFLKHSDLMKREREP